MAMASLEGIQAREAQHVLQTYRRQPITFVRGEGVRLYDSDGREYLDLLSGIGVNALGHAHPALTRAIADQASTLLHTSNLFYHPLQGHLAERLCTFSGMSRAFFCNSGAEAVEACLKFARRYWFTRGEPRAEFIALEESFHGRTIGALSVTSDEHYRAPFAPLLSDVRWVPINDPTAIRDAVTSKTAAVIVEPIQGEGGVRPLTPAFATALGEACAKSGALLIADEVQSGFGRTGELFYSLTLGLKPHLIAVGKALGGGVPVGSVLLGEEVASRIAYGDHGTTYGGNLLACRAALVVLEELMDNGLMAHVAAMGRVFETGLRAIAARRRNIREVRGAGLMWGVELTHDATAIVPAGLKRGVIVNRTAETVVRLLPPYVITEADAHTALDRLDAAIGDIDTAGAAS